MARAQTRFGYSAEDLRLILTPMGAEGHEPVWSMGDDAPFAILSDKPHGLADYFRQRFAQVTNPPIDPLRERAVMSLDTWLGPRTGLLAGLLGEGAAPGRLIHLPSPVLTPDALGRLRTADCGMRNGDGAVATLPAFFDAAGGGTALASALEQLQADALRAIESGATILIVSDNSAQSAIRNPQSAIPALLAVAAVHQGLIRAGRRLEAEIVAEAGDAWSTQHLTTLLAYGAAAVCPYVACASARALATVPEGADEGAARDGAEARYVASLEEGLLKIMSKMGISAVRSYHGSGLFEAFGLGQGLIDAYFPGTPSPLGGIGLEEIAADAAARGAAADALPAPDGKRRVGLPDHGFVRFRRDGERHAYAPVVVKALQGMVDAVGGVTEEVAARYLGLTESSAGAPLALRDLLALRPAGPPVPLDAVEPVEAIRPRFIATAMSLGALSPEAYTTLAAGMNRIGARSNSGEGGEDPDWYGPQADGERRHSKIKQIASGRFGVNANYLVHAEELEIKMAQGSKPGEGGQLPAHKVTDFIARLRHAVPGTSLISPPPHHDIYSIEDIAQLIFDLRTVQPTARIGVKLVATSGVGTIAAGVAKAGANYVLISGHSGGTGASPLSSIKHAGLPWELGLAEAQQTLIRSGLRDRVRLRTDGGLRTARDVLVAAALGAEDYGFGTAALVALGCDMARQCHLNTCPTGIATQRADLRAKFRGTPEQVVTYFTWLAEQVRALLAELGLRSLDEAVGRVGLLAQLAEVAHPRAATLDLAPLLAAPPAGAPTRSNPALGPLASPIPLSERLLAGAAPALAGDGPVTLVEPIRNRDRAIGAELAGALARRSAAARHGGAAPAPITVELAGSAGQSFGAFGVAGLTLRLTGEANDYVGKGLSGGAIVIGRSEGDSAIRIHSAIRNPRPGRQHRPLRRDRRGAVRRRGGGGAVRGAQQRRDGGGRGGRRPRLRVHDRRDGAGARPDRAQLRRRDERGPRLHPRRGGRLPGPLQPGAGQPRPPGARRRRPGDHPRAAGAAPRTDRQRPRRRRSRRLGPLRRQLLAGHRQAAGQTGRVDAVRAPRAPRRAQRPRADRGAAGRSRARARRRSGGRLGERRNTGVGAYAIRPHAQPEEGEDGIAAAQPALPAVPERLRQQRGGRQLSDYLPRVRHVRRRRGARRAAAADRSPLRRLRLRGRLQRG